MEKTILEKKFAKCSRQKKKIFTLLIFAFHLWKDVT